MMDATSMEKWHGREPRGGCLPNVAVLLKSLLNLLREQPLLSYHESVFRRIERQVLLPLDCLEHLLNHQRRIHWLCSLQEKTGLPASYVALLGAVVTFKVVHWWIRVASRLLCNILTILYPAMKTVEVLRYGMGRMSTREQEQRQIKEREQWLSYWLVYAFATLTDHFRALIPLQ